MVIAYLRVSTEKQFLANQKEEIMRFAEKNGLSIDKWYTETVSGSVSTKDRKLSELLKRMHPGDGGNRKEPDFDAYQRSSRTQKAGRNDFRPKERGYA